MSNVLLQGLLPWLVLIFILSGIVKGLTGFGMPFIAIPSSTIILGVPVTQAMGWVLASAFVTNLVQLFQTRANWKILHRIWLPVSTLLVTMAFSVQLLTVIKSEWLLVILGVIIILAISFQLKQQWIIRENRKSSILIASGLVSGLFGGVTAFYGFPFLPTLVASGIRDESFIFSASFILLTGGLVLATGLGSQGLMTATDTMLSVVLFFPALVGMFIGQRARRKLSTKRFELIVLVVLFGTGTSLLLRGLLEVARSI